MAKLLKWPCIFGLHDHNFMKFGHQIICRGTKHWKNSNDFDMASNDLELLIFIISDIWSKLLPPNNMKMNTIPAYNISGN